MEMQECAAALHTIAESLERVWPQTFGNEALWEARIDGPVYRDTPILGCFRWYRRLRVWWLRRQLHM